jgi:hypothetical protein
MIRAVYYTLTFVQCFSPLLPTPSYQSGHAVLRLRGLLSCSARAFVGTTYQKKTLWAYKDIFIDSNTLKFERSAQHPNHRKMKKMTEFISPDTETFEHLPICNFSNFTTKCICLVDKLRLCRPTHGRVTWLQNVEHKADQEAKPHFLVYDRTGSQKCLENRCLLLKCDEVCNTWHQSLSLFCVT